MEHWKKQNPLNIEITHPAIFAIVQNKSLWCAYFNVKNFQFSTLTIFFIIKNCDEFLCLTIILNYTSRK